MGRSSKTDRSERAKDMANAEAWAEVFKEHRRNGHLAMG
jgi:hypothetical protein